MYLKTRVVIGPEYVITSDGTIKAIADLQQVLDLKAELANLRATLDQERVATLRVLDDARRAFEG